MQERPMYDAMIESTWALASAIGPLIGGLLTQHLSWRWCFFINLPIGLVAVLLLGFFLNLNPVKKRSVKEVAVTFDYLGLFLLVAGTALLLIGFQFAETAERHWRAPETIAALVISVVCIALGILNEIYTKQDPIIPPRLFRVPTTACILIGGVHPLSDVLQRKLLRASVLHPSRIRPDYGRCEDPPSELRLRIHVYHLRCLHF